MEKLLQLIELEWVEAHLQILSLVLIHAMTYKNFDLNMYWNGAAGGYNSYEWSFMSGTLANVQRDVFDRAWSLDNPNAPAPR